MSCRTRIKKHGRNSKLGLNHHQSYSMSSSTYQSLFHTLGQPIELPKLVKPLLHDNELNFVGSIPQLVKINTIPYEEIRHANLSFLGTVFQREKTVINVMALAVKSFCFCSSLLTDTPSFRKKYYTQYEEDDYEPLITILSRLTSCQQLVLNIQDNMLSQAKINKLQQVFTQSRIRSITVRNMAYLTIEPIQLVLYFSELRANPHIDFKFIWHTFILQSKDNKDKLTAIKQEPDEEQITFMKTYSL